MEATKDEPTQVKPQKKATAKESPGESTALSPFSKSRYGRTHKPKISDDFYNIDDVFDIPKAPVKSPNRPGPKLPKNAAKKKPISSKSTKTKINLMVKSPPVLHITGDSSNNWQPVVKVRKFFKRSPEVQKVDLPKKVSSQSKFLEGDIEDDLKLINEALEAPTIDVTKVLKIVSNKVADQEQTAADSKSSGKAMLRTYGNKRKSYLKPEVVESFALPDVPFVPLDEDKPPNKPRRIKELDVEASPSETVNIVDKKLLETPWEIANADKTDHTQDLKDIFVDLNKKLEKKPVPVELSPKKNSRKSKHVIKDCETMEIIDDQTEQMALRSAKISSSPIKKTPKKTPKIKRLKKLPLSENIPVVKKEEIKLEITSPKAVRKRKTRSETPQSTRQLRSSSLVHVIEKAVETIDLTSVRNVEIKENLNSEPPCEEEAATIETGNIKQEEKDEEDISPEIQLLNSSAIVKEESGNYDAGDLMWAKVGSYPFWPCMISAEPESGIFKNYKAFRKLFHTVYHVRFFGDNGRRAWINSIFMKPFAGKGDPDSFTDLPKLKTKTTPRLTSRLTLAVEEAESLKSKTAEERFNFFFDMFASKREKRKQLIELKNFDLQAKQIKAEDIDDKEPAKKNLKKRFSLSLDKSTKKNSKLRSPSLSPVSVKNEQIEGEKEKADGEVETDKISEIRPKKRKTRSSSIRDNIFKNSLSKNVANLNEESVEAFLQQSNFLNSELKKEVLSSEYSFSDTDSNSKSSLNSNVPTAFETQELLYKKNNLFKGVSREKVCQICLKPQKVLKCKGLCGGSFHKSCAEGVDRSKSYETVKIEKPNETNPEITNNPTPEGQEKETVGATEKEKEVSPKGPDTDRTKVEIEIVPVDSCESDLNLTLTPNKSCTPDSNTIDLTLAEQIDLKMKEVMQKFEYKTSYADSTTDYTSSEENVNEKGGEDVKIMKVQHVTADHISFISVHSDSQTLSINTEDDFKCNYCSAEVDPPCFVCNLEISKKGSPIRQKCSQHRCGKFYHPDCLKLWPQTQWSLTATVKHKQTDVDLPVFTCPHHSCHTCISDDPRCAGTRSGDKIVRCLRCPASYQASSHCIPAGSNILSVMQIVCPRHLGQKKIKRARTINTTWCFICSEGGDLICCETCPTSVHTDCLKVNLTDDDTFICEDCESGRFPLYDEIVWVKLGAYRWWPAIILFPNEIPSNVRNIPHDEGEFVVKFFGTHDHYWVSRGRSFLFQEGDKGHSSPSKTKVDAVFQQAVEEAIEAHNMKKDFKKIKEEEMKMDMKPPKFIKIKGNKAVGNVRQFDGNVSNTTPCDCDPNQDSPCGPDSDCLNRLLLTECNPEVCPAGERCHNQRFEKRVYPPVVPYKTQARGWGLKTVAPLRKGDFVIEYIGEIIDEQEYQRRIHKMHEQKEENYYFLTIDKDRMIDAGPKGNVARFMNHSCQPNCETQKWTVNGDTRVGLFAVEDIPENTELTFNYNLECIGKEKKICRCDAPNCSGFIGVKAKPDESQKKPKKPQSKIKKKKRSPTPMATVSNDGPCFLCNETGSVNPCQNKICNKFYHLKCVQLDSWPEGKWVCPWHNCNTCGKRTIRCCVKCINSYCPSHSDGNVRYDKLLGFVCSEHDPTKESHELQIEPTSVRKAEKPVLTEENDVTSTTPDEIEHKVASGKKPPSIEEGKSDKKNSKQTKSDENLEDFESNLTIHTVPNVKQKKDIPSDGEESEPAIKEKRKRGRPKKATGNHSKKRKVQKKEEDVVRPKPNATANSLLDNFPVQNEVKLSTTVPLRHLRTTRNVSMNESISEFERFLKRQRELEKDLPIRKRSRPRCETTL